MATLDWITLEAGIEAINASSTPALSLRVAQQITAISLIGDDLAGPVVQRTITAEYHDGGGELVTLTRRPVASITTVRMVTSPGTIETLSASAWGASTTGYFAPKWDRDNSLLSGVLHRRVSGTPTYWPTGPHAVEVTYVAGRVATTALVGERYKEAAGAALRRLWKRESGAWAQSADFFASQLEPDTAAGSGFFKAVEPVLIEMLGLEVQPKQVMVR